MFHCWKCLLSGGFLAIFLTHSNAKTFSLLAPFIISMFNKDRFGMYFCLSKRYALPNLIKILKCVGLFKYFFFRHASVYSTYPFPFIFLTHSNAKSFSLLASFYSPFFSIRIDLVCIFVFLKDMPFSSTYPFPFIFLTHSTAKSLPLLASFFISDRFCMYFCLSKRYALPYLINILKCVSLSKYFSRQGTKDPVCLVINTSAFQDNIDGASFSIFLKVVYYLFIRL